MSDRLAHSYYAATANPSAAPARLAGHQKADVVVVGGGFSGLSAALACAEKGLSVILLEAGDIGSGAAGRNGGQLIPGLRWGIREIDAAFGRVRARAIFDLAWSAGQRVRDRISRHEIACDLKSGHLAAACKPAHFADMQREAEMLTREFGWQSVTVVPAAEMGAHVRGGDYCGGLYDRCGGHFHPLNYALGLADAARQAGVRIFTHSRVVSLSDDRRVIAETAAGSVEADHAVLATDAWMGDVAPDIGRHTVPIMNYNVATAPLLDAAALLPSDAAVADSRFVLNYFRLSSDRRLIFGGGERYRQTPPADIAAFVRPHMAAIFPALASVPIDYAWGGTVAVTMNRLPHIGRRGRVFFAHGFSGHGAMITTLTGEILAEALTGTVGRFDVLAGLPSRAFPGGPFLARPLATLGLIWYAMRGRL